VTLAYVHTSIEVEWVGNRAAQMPEVPPNPLCMPILPSLQGRERKEAVSRSVLRNTDPALLPAALRQAAGIRGKERELVSQVKAALYLQPAFFDSLRPLLDSLPPESKTYQLLFAAVMGAESIPSQHWL